LADDLSADGGGEGFFFAGDADFAADLAMAR
jgi:hypothetical protein